MTLKQRLQPFAWPAYLVLLGVVASGTFVVEATAHAGHHSVSAGPAAACPTAGKTVLAPVNGSSMTPNSLEVHRCDTIVFRNDSKQVLELAFGPHERHIEYPGLKEAPLKPGATLKLQMTVAGTFPLHDHFADSYKGQVTVK